MVTIEQKLSVFNKLLQRSMNENFAEEMEYLRREYSKKLQQNNSAVDKEVKHIEQKAFQRAEKAKTEILNKAAINQRKAYMSAKEEFFSLMLIHLRERIDSFIQSEEYKAYLISLAQQLENSEKDSKGIKVFVTQRDLKKYGKDIAAAMPKALANAQSIEVADDKIIGGLILTNAETDTRIDLSVSALLEENKSYMMQIFFQALSPCK